jgi:ABC-2 type transport system permease protein
VALEAPAHSPDAPGVRTTSFAPPLDAGERRPKQTRVVSSDIDVGNRLREIWRSRELLVYLVRTEIKVKYKNSFLGLLWSMVSPAMSLLVYTIVFGVLEHTTIHLFVIFLFSGLLFWNFFQTGVLTATGVVVNNAGLVKKVSFPREILALAAIGSAGVFLFFQACVMVLFMLIFWSPPDWPLLWLLVVAFVPTVVFSAALGILFASVNVYMRDTQHLVTVIVGAAWFWACPIVYSYQELLAPRLAKDHITWLYFLNPMTSLVMTVQRVLYRPNPTTALPPWGWLHYVLLDLGVLGFSVILFYVAMVVFGRLAGNFAEEL